MRPLPTRASALLLSLASPSSGRSGRRALPALRLRSVERWAAATKAAVAQELPRAPLPLALALQRRRAARLRAEWAAKRAAHERRFPMCLALSTVRGCTIA